THHLPSQARTPPTGHASRFFCLTLRRALPSTLFPYTTLFRSRIRFVGRVDLFAALLARDAEHRLAEAEPLRGVRLLAHRVVTLRSEEHTSELQSRGHLVCRLLLEKKKRISIHRLPRLSASVTT